MSDVVNESNGEWYFNGEFFGNAIDLQKAKHDAAMAAIQNTR